MNKDQRVRVTPNSTVLREMGVDPGLQNAKAVIEDITMVAVVRKAKGRNLAPACPPGEHTVETQTDERGKTGRWCTKCGHREQDMQLLTLRIGRRKPRRVQVVSAYVEPPKGKVCTVTFAPAPNGRTTWKCDCGMRGGRAYKYREQAEQKAANHVNNRK